MRWWRWATYPSPALTAVLLVAAAATLIVATLPAYDALPDLTIVPVAVLVAAAAHAYGGPGRADWAAAAVVAAWLTGMYLLSGERDIGLLMLTAPAFLAGTALRLRRRTAESLAERGRELERERSLFADLTVRNERARIASELHDIVGHSLSVMVVQAAAGQRRVQRDPAAGAEVLRIIADSARQGREDLRRLIDLLGGQEEVTLPDLALVEELVARAARTGLEVTCRVEGDTSHVPGTTAELAFNVVREGLTNALRHSPGAPVRVLLRADGAALRVQVDNDAPRTDSQEAMARILGTEQGLRGLRDRVELVGGRFRSGATTPAGWQVRVDLPA